MPPKGIRKSRKKDAQLALSQLGEAIQQQQFDPSGTTTTTGTGRKRKKTATSSSVDAESGENNSISLASALTTKCQLTIADLEASSRGAHKTGGNFYCSRSLLDQFHRTMNHPLGGSSGGTADSVVPPWRKRAMEDEVIARLCQMMAKASHPHTSSTSTSTATPATTTDKKPSNKIADAVQQFVGLKNVFKIAWSDAQLVEEIIEEQSSTPEEANEARNIIQKIGKSFGSDEDAAAQFTEAFQAADEQVRQWQAQEKELQTIRDLMHDVDRDKKSSSSSNSSGSSTNDPVNLDAEKARKWDQLMRVFDTQTNLERPLPPDHRISEEVKRSVRPSGSWFADYEQLWRENVLLKQQMEVLLSDTFRELILERERENDAQQAWETERQAVLRQNRKQYETACRLQRLETLFRLVLVDGDEMAQQQREAAYNDSINQQIGQLNMTLQTVEKERERCKHRIHITMEKRTRLLKSQFEANREAVFSGTNIPFPPQKTLELKVLEDNNSKHLLQVLETTKQLEEEEHQIQVWEQLKELIDNGLKVLEDEKKEAAKQFHKCRRKFAVPSDLAREQKLQLLREETVNSLCEAVALREQAQGELYYSNSVVDNVQRQNQPLVAAAAALPEAKQNVREQILLAVTNDGTTVPVPQSVTAEAAQGTPQPQPVGVSQPTAVSYRQHVLEAWKFANLEWHNKSDTQKFESVKTRLMEILNQSAVSIRAHSSSIATTTTPSSVPFLPAV